MLVIPHDGNSLACVLPQSLPSSVFSGHVGSLKMVAMGVLTPQKLSNFTNQGLVPLESQLLSMYQHTAGHTQVRQPLIE